MLLARLYFGSPNVTAQVFQWPKFKITEYENKYSVHYFVDLEVFHDPTKFLINLVKLLLRRPREFSSPDHISRDSRALLHDPRGF